MSESDLKKFLENHKDDELIKRALDHAKLDFLHAKKDYEHADADFAHAERNTINALSDFQNAKDDLQKLIRITTLANISSDDEDNPTAKSSRELKQASTDFKLAIKSFKHARKDLEHAIKDMKHAHQDLSILVTIAKDEGYDVTLHDAFALLERSLHYKNT